MLQAIDHVLLPAFASWPIGPRQYVRSLPWYRPAAGYPNALSVLPLETPENPIGNRTPTVASSCSVAVAVLPPVLTTANAQSCWTAVSLNPPALRNAVSP